MILKSVVYWTFAGLVLVGVANEWPNRMFWEVVLGLLFFGVIVGWIGWRWWHSLSTEIAQRQAALEHLKWLRRQ